MPAEKAWPVPDDVPAEQIASLMINPATALLMVRYVLAVPRGEWLLQSAASGELGRMIIRLAQHDGIKTINVVRRRDAAQELTDLGADAVIVSGEGPIDEQVRNIVGAQGVGFAIDSVAGEIGTEIFRSLSEEGHMLLYGSLSGQGISVGERPPAHPVGPAHPRGVLAGLLAAAPRQVGFFPPNRPAIPQLIDEIVELIRAGILSTSPGEKFGLDDIRTAVTQAESVGHNGKVFLAPN